NQCCLSPHFSSQCAVIFPAELQASRKWWNWQTHHLEGVAPKGMRVQIPPSAPFLPRAGAKSGDCMLHALVVFVHVMVCLFLIIVVLVQSGQSADLAAAFGGQGSQTAFGPRGAATLMTRLTTWCAIIFMLTSITLSVMHARRTGGSVFAGEKTQQQAPAPAKK